MGPDVPRQANEQDVHDDGDDRSRDCAHGVCCAVPQAVRSKFATHILYI